MNNKLLIPLCLFITVQAVYDFFGLIQNTNWSIFYYTGQYASWLLLIILLKKPRDNTKKIPYFVLASGLFIYIGIELSRLGMNYEQYYLSVNEYEKCIIPISVIISGLTYFIVKKWRQ